jgi:hypothetical protein
VEGHLALFGNAVCDDALEFCAQRKHGAEHFPQRREIVIGDPAAKAKQEIVKHRGKIENVGDILRGDVRLAIVQFRDNARHALLAEGDEHASANDGKEVPGNTVGEDHVQRDRQGYVAEFGH